MNVPLLGEIPLDTETREGGDSGKPIALAATAQSQRFIDLANTVIEKAEASKQRHRPTVTISD
jgi:hypothetical protein